MARTRGQSQENLDPLLDTMANVVGILVVLVAVTQLSVTNAVERIRDKGPEASVTVEELAGAERAVVAVEAAVAGAEGELAAHAPSAVRAGMLMDTLEPRLERLEALAGRASPAELDAHAIEARIADAGSAIAEGERASSATQTKLLELQRVLDTLPTEERPKLARLPDPRPPPDDSVEVAFFVRYGQVAAIDIDRLALMLDKGRRDALGVNRRLRSEDAPWLINLFAKMRHGDDLFYWRLRETPNGGLFADVVWRSEEQGENRFQLADEDSAFLAALGEASPERNFIRFYVWADSFDAYLEARYLAESRGFLVSWLPADLTTEVGRDMQGGHVSRILVD